MIQILPRRRPAWPFGRVLLLVGVMLPLLTFLPPVHTGFAAEPTAAATVQTAWELVQRLGQYNFATQIEQTTYPAPKVANVGRAPQVELIYLEGAVDRPSDEVTLRLWQNGGSLLDPSGAVEMRVTEGQAFARHGDDAWQPLDNADSLFAPNNDPLAFLAAIKDVRAVPEAGGPGVENAADPSATIRTFSFAVDGPAFADHLRTQMEQTLRARGELPPGVRLESDAGYRKLAGTGTLWIDGDGLPLRLYLTLALPPEANGDQVTAVIRTDFSGFDLAQLTPLTTTLAQWSYAVGLPQTIGDWQRVGGGLLVGGVALVLLWLMMAFRRSQHAYRTVAAAVLLGQLVTPILQAQRVSAFIDERTPIAATDPAAEAVEQTAALPDDLAIAARADLETDADQLTALRTAAGGFPERAPATIHHATQPTLSWRPAAQNTAGSAEDSDGDGVTDSVEAEWGSDPNVTDSDGDGLTDGQEVNELGTDPTSVDSDADGLPDQREVQGFVVGGRRWYPDPRRPDSNGDGLIDGVECPEQSTLNSSATLPPCTDLDGDGVPNLFDEDNDGDSAPDTIDLAPEHVAGKESPFTGAAPFALTVNGLTAGEPTYLDIQLRPANPAPLTYAMGVFDWPTNDTRGHIQRRLDTTFATTANADIRSSDSNAANGDMRLLPMLSMRIAKAAGHYGNLPTKADAATLTAASTVADWIAALDTDKLRAYNMSVREYDVNTLELLTPLAIQPDSNGMPAAFGAHLLYWPTTGTWGAAQEARLVWVIQLITDQCVDPDREGEAFCTDPANRRDTPTIAHAYEEAWYLTGVTVSEQLGTDVAVIRGATNRSVDENLWLLGDRLAEIFVGGVDANHDAQRDLTIAEIARRWQVGTTADSADRFAIPAGATDVTTFAYEHSDEYIHVMMTELRTILAQFSPNVAPTLLIATEQQRREQTLAEAAISGRTVTVDFTAATPRKVSAQVTWSPYRYVSGAWENYPVADYLNDLLTPALAAHAYFVPAGSARADLMAANDRVDIARALYLTLNNGYGALVAYGDQLITMGQPTPVPGAAAATTGTGDSLLVDLIVKYQYEARYFGRYVSARHLLANYAYARAAGALGAAVVATTLLVVEFTGADRRIVHGVAGAVTTTMAIGLSIRLIHLYRQSSYLQNGVYNLAKLRAVSAELNIASKALKTGAAGLVVGLILAWGAYVFYGLSTGEWDNAAVIGHAAAASTVVLFLFLVAVAAGPLVGAAIALVFLLFEGIVMLLCGVGVASGAICGGLVGLLAGLFYEVNQFVDLEDNDRLKIEDVDLILSNPNGGMAVGNTLTYRVYVFNGLRAAGNPYSLAGRVRQSSFAYSLNEYAANIHGHLGLGQMFNLWNFDAGTGRFEYRTAPTQSFNLTSTGINMPHTLYLNEGFAVPYEECYKVFGFRVKCKTKTLRDSNAINLSDMAVLDILPATLDGFLQMEARGNGAYALAWSNQGQLRFPPLADADGDGLRNRTAGGADPDDRQWDSDGDGLSDRYEHEQGTPATNPDADGDGLTDAAELHLGTDPHRADTDYDGLTDYEEVLGWEFVYGFQGTTPLRSWVYSSPLDADADGDELIDAEEYRLGYNPNVASSVNIMSYDAAIRNPALPADAPISGVFARPGQTIYYDADVRNNLNNRYIYGQLTTQGAAGLTTATNPDSFFLLPNQAVVRSQPVSVQPGLASGPYQLSQVARGYVKGPEGSQAGGTQNAQSLGAESYFPFDRQRLLDGLAGTNSAKLTCLRCPGATTAGKIGDALQFDDRNGHQEYVDGTQLLPYFQGDAWTLAAWIYLKREGYNADVIFDGHSGDYWSQRLNFFYSNAYAQSGFALLGLYDNNTFRWSSRLAYEQWYHVALTVDKGQGKLYINGNLNQTYPSTLKPGSDWRFSIGAERRSYDYIWGTFNDRIDELHMFNRALDENELRALMGSGQQAGLSASTFDLPFERVTSSNFSLNRNYYDRSGSTRLATCSTLIVPICPTRINTPWGNGIRTSTASALDVAVSDVRRGYTLSTWLYPAATSTGWTRFITDRITSATDPHYLPQLSYHRAEGRVRVEIAGNIASIESPQWILQPDRWNHITVTSNRDQLRLYINGTLAGSTNLVEQTFPGVVTSALRIGTNPADLDEMQLFDYVLNESQVRRLYSGEWDQLLRLRFEDPPGSTRYLNSTLPEQDGICASDPCPATSVAGRNGQATLFTTTEQQIELAEGIGRDPLEQFTVSGWIRGSGTILTRNPGGTQDFFQFSTTGFGIKVLNSAGQIEDQFLAMPPAAIPDPAVWTHLAATYSGQPDRHEMHLYVNGVEVAANTNGPIGILGELSTPLLVGKGFTGRLDEIQLYRSVLSPEKIYQNYLTSAPALRLAFDEAAGAQSFADSTGNFSPNCTSCPSAGERGRLSDAAHFTGTNTLVAAPANTLTFAGDDAYAILLWAKSDMAAGETGVLYAQEPTDGSAAGLRLTVTGGNDGLDSVRLQVFSPTFSPFGDLTAPIRHNAWNQLAIVRDQTTLRLYLNGTLAAEVVLPAWGWTPLTGAITVGGPQIPVPGLHSFTGLIDEVAVYRGALGLLEIEEIYEQQSGWVEERSSLEVIIDSDPPTTTIRSNSTYRPNAAALLDLYAADPTSLVDHVELLVNGVSSPAPACLESNRDSAWCPTFTPRGEGRYTLQSRATDLLGHQALSEQVTVLVDATALPCSR
ncbi:MAG: LamG-like jellyroll fold domain-containing protein [Caldilineaceae bacterium]